MEKEFVHCLYLELDLTLLFFFSIHLSCLLLSVFHLDGAGEQAGSPVTPHCQPWERVMAVLTLPVGPHRTEMQN